MNDVTFSSPSTPVASNRNPSREECARGIEEARMKIWNNLHKTLKNGQNGGSTPIVGNYKGSYITPLNRYKSKNRKLKNSRSESSSSRSSSNRCAPSVDYTYSSSINTEDRSTKTTRERTRGRTEKRQFSYDLNEVQQVSYDELITVDADRAHHSHGSNDIDNAGGIMIVRSEEMDHQCDISSSTDKSNSVIYEMTNAPSMPPSELDFKDGSFKSVSSTTLSRDDSMIGGNHLDEVVRRSCMIQKARQKELMQSFSGNSILDNDDDDDDDDDEGRKQKNITSPTVSEIGYEVDRGGLTSDLSWAPKSSFDQTDEDELDLVLESFVNSSSPQYSPHVARIETPKVLPYVHGSFAAAAPLMLLDRKWMRILRKLMPDAHAQAALKLRQICSGAKNVNAQIMKWAENNPVVAAYGMLYYLGKSSEDSNSLTDNDSNRSQASHSDDINMGENENVRVHQESSSSLPPGRKLPVLEWDIFLDPYLTSMVDDALERFDNAKKKRDKVKAHIEVEKEMSRLIKRVVLSHGSTTQLASEALGIPSGYTFSNIVTGASSRRSFSGKRHEKKSSSASPHQEGPFVGQWLSVFARALHLGKQKSVKPTPQMEMDEEEAVIFRETVEDMTQLEQYFCGALLCLGYNDPNSARVLPMSHTVCESAMHIQRLLGGSLRVFLDLKSRRVPPRVWAKLVDTFRSHGILVEGVGSFDIKELRAIGSQTCASIRLMRFFHSAGDLQRACHSNEIHVGDTVFLNAGSLLRRSSLPVGCFEFEDFALACEEERYHSDTESTIEDYKVKYRLNVGCYVQEFAISNDAVNAIVQFINKNEHIYNAGLAWGGIPGVAARGLEGDGFWAQRYLGTMWNKDWRPTAGRILSLPCISINGNINGNNASLHQPFQSGGWGQLATVNNSPAPITPLFTDMTTQCTVTDITTTQCSSADDPGQYAPLCVVPHPNPSSRASL